MNLKYRISNGTMYYVNSNRYYVSYPRRFPIGSNRSSNFAINFYGWRFYFVNDIFNEPIGIKIRQTWN